MRWLLAWTLFWLGDAASKVLNHIPDAWEKAQEALYTIYNRLMVTSLKIQKGDQGPWKEVRDRIMAP